MMPTSPATHDGVPAAFGCNGTESESVCALIEFGLRSTVYASLVDAIGNVPVVWSIGRSLLVNTRLSPDFEIVNEAFGHATEPST